MAGSFHDQDNFESDLTIEVARKGDMLEAGQELKDKKCKKNPGHEGFIPFKNLILEHLPEDIRHTDILDSIKKIGSCVVRLVVVKMKNGEKITESGSGLVSKNDNTYYVKTNNHVVGTEDEVKHCTVEFHYDSTDRSSVLYSRGVKLLLTDPFRDITYFAFYPVPDFLHQLELRDIKFSNICYMDETSQVLRKPAMRSFRSDSLFYTSLNLNNLNINIMRFEESNGSISYLTSSYFKFKPISPDIQELTSISICIDKDDGTSRVIPGDVIKLDDEFLVQIYEFMFQYEVQKCKLMKNCEVIGYGTRLYFRHVETKKYFSDVDQFDLDFVYNSNYFWLFDCHPKTGYIAFINSLDLTTTELSACCIGHPHSGIKMVTFGRFLGSSEKYFTIIDEENIIESPEGQRVCCIEYSCRTCSGSSGSPVLAILFGKVQEKECLAHFMGKRITEVLSNGEQIENKNIAWAPILIKNTPTLEHFV